MGAMNLNETIFLKDIKLPPGVTVPELVAGRDIPVVSIHAPRAEEPEAAAAAAADCSSRAGRCQGGRRQGWRCQGGRCQAAGCRR